MAFKESISRESFIGVRWVVLGVFWMVLTGGTVFFFTTIFAEPLLKVLMVLLGIAWELGSTVIIALIKTKLRGASSVREVLRAFPMILGYAVTSTVSFMGVIGLLLAFSGHQSDVAKNTATTVNAGNAVITTLTNQNTQLDAEIAAKNLEVTAITAKRDEYKLGNWWYGKYQKDIEAANQIIKDDQKTQQDNLAKITAASTTVTTNAETSVTSESVFTGIGNMFGQKDPEVFRRLMFALISLIIQIIVAVAAPFIRHEDLHDLKKKVNTMELRKYIEALFNVTGRKLAKDIDIAKALRISEEKCVEYRNYLFTTTYKEAPLLVRDHGGTKANVNPTTKVQFTKDEIVQIVMLYNRIGTVKQEAVA